MELIKVKLPPFTTCIEGKEDYCVAALYVNAWMLWAGRCDNIAVFEAEKTCQVGILIYDARVRYPYPYHQDLVITSILSPGKQYELRHDGFSFEFIEVEEIQ